MHKRMLLMNMLFSMLAICSIQSACGADIIATHAHDLLALTMQDAIGHELAQYSLTQLQELKQILVNKKIEAQSELTRENIKNVLSGALLSIMPACMLYVGVIALLEACKKHLCSKETFSFAENILGIPGEAALYKHEAKTLYIWGAILSCLGVYSLSKTVPMLVAGSEDAEQIVQRSGLIIDLIDEKLKMSVN